MRRFILMWNDGTNIHNIIVALVKNSTTFKYHFVDLTNDTMWNDTFRTPAEALDWLDKWAEEQHDAIWEPTEKI